MEFHHVHRLVCLLLIIEIKLTSPFFLSSNVIASNKKLFAASTEPFQAVSENSPPTLQTSLDWSFVDKAYLITCPNADPNSERLNKAKSILTEVGLIDSVKVMEFDTDDEDRIRGCYASHISVLKCAKDEIQSNQFEDSNKNWWRPVLSFLENDKSHDKKGTHESGKKGGGVENSRKILVLEDNIACNGDLNKDFLESIADFVSNTEGSDMILLSYIPYVPNLIVSRTGSENIVKVTSGVGSALGTTAYIIDELAIDAILKEDAERGYYAAIPDVMALLFPDSRFAAFPTPFLRAPKTKSLVNPQLDDLRSVLFQPAFVAQFQNVLTWTGVSTNVIFFSMIGSLLLGLGISGKSTATAMNEIITTGSYDGNLAITLVNLLFSTFCLAVLAQGAFLAPKPPQQEQVTEEQNGTILI